MMMLFMVNDFNLWIIKIRLFALIVVSLSFIIHILDDNDDDDNADDHNEY